MDGLLSTFLIILIVGNINGFKWVPSKSGEALPKNAVLIEYSWDRYVGRAKHFDDILPAEVDRNGLAEVSSCGEVIRKDDFEILTSSNGCDWRFESEIKGQEESILRVETNYLNDESIYVGVDRIFSPHIASIYSNTNDIKLWKRMRISFMTKWRILCCKFPTKWIQPSSATKLPNNSIFGGKSNNGHEIYVARLKRDCDLIIGQAIPELGIAKAFLSNGTTLEAQNFEVLISDEENDYIWVLMSNGKIPENVIVVGNAFVARLNKNIVGLTRSEAKQKSNYEILVGKSL